MKKKDIPPFEYSGDSDDFLGFNLYLDKYYKGRNPAYPQNFLNEYSMQLNENKTKMTEDEVIKHLMKHLEQSEWTIEKFCLGQDRGNDIEATRLKERLIVEAKGARSSDTAPTRKRVHFDSGQIKTHFGKAIVKILEEKNKYPKGKFAIAHPNDAAIKKAIGETVPFLKKMEIIHYWVSENGLVIEES